VFSVTFNYKQITTIFTAFYFKCKNVKCFKPFGHRSCLLHLNILTGILFFTTTDPRNNNYYLKHTLSQKANRLVMLGEIIISYETHKKAVNTTVHSAGSSYKRQVVCMINTALRV